jgi:WD40 repeat protein
VLLSNRTRLFGSTTGTVAPHGGFVGYEISPGGTWVVATTETTLATGISLQPELVLIDTRSGEESVIARAGGSRSFNGPITWSPDGTRIAYRFVRYRTDPSIVHPGPHPELLTACVIELSTSGRTCYPDLGTVFEFAWSPDGASLAVTGPGPNPIRLLDVTTGGISTPASLDDPELRDAVGGRAVQFTSPAWSASGGYLAVWVNAIPAGSVPVVFGRDGRVVTRGLAAVWDPRRLAWLPGRDLLLYTPGVTNERTAQLEVFELDPATGEERVVLKRSSLPQIVDLALSPTGRWVALLRWTSYARLKLAFVDLTGDREARDIRLSFETGFADWGPDAR